jgi:hypothetical protein
VSKWKEPVTCPIEECGRPITQRGNLVIHIKKVHDFPHDEAFEMAVAADATAPAKPTRKRKSKALAVIEPPKPRDFDPTDIALGVIESQSNGTVPTEMLHEVIAYVDHTRLIVQRLREKR